MVQKSLVRTLLIFFVNHYAWLYKTCEKLKDVSSTSLNSASVENSEVGKEIVDHIINIEQKSLGMNKIIVGQLNSIRYIFDFLAQHVEGNIDILTISERKLNESFPVGQFLIDG